MYLCIGHRSPFAKLSRLEELPESLTIFWTTGTRSMKQLFHSQEDFDLRYLTLFAVVNFLFTCLSVSL